MPADAVGTLSAGEKGLPLLSLVVSRRTPAQGNITKVAKNPPSAMIAAVTVAPHDAKPRREGDEISNMSITGTCAIVCRPKRPPPKLAPSPVDSLCPPRIHPLSSPSGSPGSHSFQSHSTRGVLENDLMDDMNKIGSSFERQWSRGYTQKSLSLTSYVRRISVLSNSFAQIHMGRRGRSTTEAESPPLPPLSP